MHLAIRHYLWRPYLHFVWCKHLDVYFAGDDGHHLQFHVYRWHSPSWLGTKMKWSSKKKKSKESVGSRNLTLRSTGLFCWELLLLDTSLRWQEWCCNNLSLPLSPSPCGSTLTSLPSSRSCFTRLQPCEPCTAESTGRFIPLLLVFLCYSVSTPHPKHDFICQTVLVKISVQPHPRSSPAFRRELAA